jgi:hypothetical protein
MRRRDFGFTPHPGNPRNPCKIKYNRNDDKFLNRNKNKPDIKHNVNRIIDKNKLTRK